MGEITTVALDIAKRIFVDHGADAAGNEVLRKKLRREDVHCWLH
jgi:transposase